MTSKIENLALPKGPRKICESCGKTGVVRCDKCKLAFYCTSEHLENDWQGVHKVICKQMKHLRGPMPFPVLEEEREALRYERRKKKFRVLKLSISISQKFLLEGRAELAETSGLTALRLGIELCGWNHSQLIVPLLLLSESKLGCSKIDESKKFLSQAERIAQVAIDIEPQQMASLYKTWGKYYSFIKHWASATYTFAEYTYYSTKYWGIDDVNNANCFFYLGHSLIDTNKEGAIANFKLMTSMWQKCIMQDNYHIVKKTQDDDSVADEYELMDVSKVRILEALKLLTKLEEYVNKQQKDDVAILRFAIFHIFLALYKEVGEADKAIYYGEQIIKDGTSAQLPKGVMENIQLQMKGALLLKHVLDE